MKPLAALARGVWAVIIEDFWLVAGLLAMTLGHVGLAILLIVFAFYDKVKQVANGIDRMTDPDLLEQKFDIVVDTSNVRGIGPGFVKLANEEHF